MASSVVTRQPLPLASPDLVAVSGPDPAILRAIHHPRTALAIWQRAMPPALAAWIDALPPHQLPSLCLECKADQASLFLAEAFAAVGVAAGEPRAILVTDMVEQIGRFAAISAGRLVQVRVEPVSDNACSKFHVDRVTVRLLITYRGPGTEWMARTGADRGAIPLSSGNIHQVSRFSVAVFKGWPDHSTRVAPPLLHRSPPIEGSGITRLLLCVSEATSHDD
jgi:hypothetical protein